MNIMPTEKLAHREKKINIPNAATRAAMDELKAGKGRHFKSLDELFKSI